MKTKTLYVLVANGGDGSYSICYTFNEAWIKEQEDRYERGESDYEFDIGIDGDGFHYDTMTVPTECTLDSLGVSDCAAEDGNE